MITVQEQFKFLVDSLATGLDKSDTESLKDELSFACEWHARLAEIIGEAKKSVSVKRGRVAWELREKDPKLSPNVLKELVNAKVADEQKFVDECTLIEQNLRLRFEGARSLLSYEKTQFNQRQSQ